MRLFKASVALAFLVALFLMPLAQAGGLMACGMFGLSTAKAPSCDGCCATMKCCAPAVHSDQSQPLQGPSPRAESDFSLIAALLPRLHFALPSSSRDDGFRRPAPYASPASVAFSLDRLCIRLI